MNQEQQQRLDDFLQFLRNVLSGADSWTAKYNRDVVHMPIPNTDAVELKLTGRQTVFIEIQRKVDGQ
jgi:hypothetical protein